MNAADESRDYSQCLVKRFLQTAVVVDDEACMPSAGGDWPDKELVAPGRRNQVSTQKKTPAETSSIHALDADSIMNGFSELGVICGVVGPIDSAMGAMRQADIVVLDWLLKDGKPEHAKSLIQDLLIKETDRNALHLVAIYTGEAQLEDISEEISDSLQNGGLEPKPSQSGMKIPYRHGCVVLYAKPSVNLVENLKSRSVAEGILPNRLIEDFASMTRGLLPGIALTSLAAVREGAHEVLCRFSSELDPAFLAHRTCLPDPDDAERQMVNHIAEEFRGLMDSAVVESSPAGAKAVERWIRCKSGKTSGFRFGNRTLGLDETLKLASKGIESSRSPLRKKDFESLSAGFSGDDNVSGLDKRLAWIMNSRTVYSSPPPVLWLGSIVTMSSAGSEQHLICMRPRCDCVRLTKETTFFFLPLVAPKAEMQQIVVKINDAYKRLGIGLDADDWILKKFSPSVSGGAVTAKSGSDGFEFEDIEQNQYKWRGELKFEYSQKIAQVFGTKLSRVAVDESEWLRRMAKKA